MCKGQRKIQFVRLAIWQQSIYYLRHKDWTEPQTHCAEQVGVRVQHKSQMSQRPMVTGKMRPTVHQNLEKPQSHRLGCVNNMLFVWLLSLWWSTLSRMEESCPSTRVEQGCLWVTGRRSALRERKWEQTSCLELWILSRYLQMTSRPLGKASFEECSAFSSWPGLKMQSDGPYWPVRQYRTISKQLHES